jgi:hypothetical protein
MGIAKTLLKSIYLYDFVAVESCPPSTFFLKKTKKTKNQTVEVREIVQ